MGLRELPDGGAELHLRLSSLQEVARWLMPWEGKGLPINSPELEEILIKAYRAGLERLEQNRARRLAAASKSENVGVVLSPVATAKSVPQNEMEETLARFASWSSDEKAEFMRRAGV